MGPSGCGKSTALRMIAGLEEPSAGDIRMFGKSMKGISAFPARHAHGLAEFSPVSIHVRGCQRGLSTAHQKRSGPLKAKNAPMNGWRGLVLPAWPMRNISRLSGGQKQRVAIAGRWSLNPAFCFWMNHSARLTHISRTHANGNLKVHKELGITFVYVTHSQSEAFLPPWRIALW